MKAEIEARFTSELDGKAVQRKEVRDEIIKLLESTGREGMDRIINFLDNLSDFFVAPASTAFHLNYDGGLAEHSLNVCHVALRLRQQMIEMKPDIADEIPEDSVIISSILHDICKCNIYKVQEKFRKDANDRWEKYIGYGVDYSQFPLGHGEKSAIMLLWLGLRLNPKELLAIRWHMTAWDLPFQSAEMKSNINEAAKQPLLSILQGADNLASHILEAEELK